MHALTTPPTFVLSQDQTLQLKRLDRTEQLACCPGHLYGQIPQPPPRPRRNAQALTEPASARLFSTTYLLFKELASGRNLSALPPRRSLGQQPAPTRKKARAFDIAKDSLRNGAEPGMPKPCKYYTTSVFRRQVHFDPEPAFFDQISFCATLLPAGGYASSRPIIPTGRTRTPGFGTKTTPGPRSGGACPVMPHRHESDYASFVFRRAGGGVSP